MVAFRIGAVRHGRVKLLRARNVNVNRPILRLSCGPDSNRQHCRLAFALLKRANIPWFHAVAPCHRFPTTFVKKRRISMSPV